MSEKKLTPGYFIPVALFSLLVPNVMGLVILLIEFPLIALLCLYALPVFDFAVMRLWGRHMSQKPYTPQILIWKYFPVLIPSLWHILTGVVFAVADPWFAETVWGAVAALDFPGFISMRFLGLPVIITRLIRDAAVISGFVIGERAVARDLGLVQPFGIKPTMVIGASVAGVMTIGGIALWYAGFGRADNSRRDYMGYNLIYEHYMSRVDLSPYYVENPDNLLAKLPEPSEFTVTGVENMPSLDGAEAAYPIYSAFAAACYNDIEKIQTDAKAAHGEKDYKSYSNASFSDMPVRFTNTDGAFKGLIEGDVDIFFGTEPSAEQYEMASGAGKELVLTPIGKEALVFFVNEKNPIDGLTSEQIRGIYSGKYNRWFNLGGEPLPILAFQCPDNPDSQSMMESFMGDTPLKKPITSGHVTRQGMYIDCVESVARYQNKRSSIGYSFRYYVEKMSGGKAGIKLLSLDGTAPDNDNILSGAYPLTMDLYAITLNDNENENVKPMLEWITGAQGQKIVEDTGYVPVSGI